MARAPANAKIIGSFREDDHGRVFDYSSNPDFIESSKAHGGKKIRFPHLIYVGPEGKETRYALVLSNVAHVIVNEDDNGWILEKWIIKNHRKYA